MSSIGFKPTYTPGGPIVGRSIPMQPIQFEKMVQSAAEGYRAEKKRIDAEKARNYVDPMDADRARDPVRSGKRALWRAYTSPPREQEQDGPPYPRPPSPERAGLPSGTRSTDLLHPADVAYPLGGVQWGHIERLDQNNPQARPHGPSRPAVLPHVSDRARNRAPGQMTMFPDLPAEKQWDPVEAKALLAASQKEQRGQSVRSWTSKPSYRSTDAVPGGVQGALMQPKEYE